MQKMTQKTGLSLAALAPMMAMAHPGHHHHTDASFWTGFVHPFTGLDHFMMALALGILLCKVATQWRVVGTLGLAVALVGGFTLGAMQMLPSTIIEYGIVASLAVLAFAMLKKTSAGLVVATLALAGFHGVAHGAELAMGGGQVALQILGMIAAMLSILATGLVTGAFIQRFVPQGQKIVAVALAIVAVISAV